MARKANKFADDTPGDAQYRLEPARPVEHNLPPITETERKLFALCFGSLIEDILAEPDE
jgi:hypothetical protein